MIVGLVGREMFAEARCIQPVVAGPVELKGMVVDDQEWGLRFPVADGPAVRP